MQIGLLMLKPSAVLVLVLAPFIGATLAARPAMAGPSTIRALERSTARLGSTRLGRSSVTVVDTPRLRLFLRPDARMIGAERIGLLHMESRGFFLGAKGRLSGSDRDQLHKLLSAAAPETNPQTVHAAVRTAATGLAQREALLRTQDGAVSQLLARAQAARAGKQDVLVWTARGGSISYRPSVDVFVGHHWTGNRALSLDGSTQADLRAFLADHR